MDGHMERSIRMDRCTGCRACIEACPATHFTDAAKMNRLPAPS